MSIPSIPKQAQENGKKTPNNPAYRFKSNGRWESKNWSTYTAEIRQVGKALMDLGVAHGDKTCILGFNRPEWNLFHIASMSIGAVPAGIYTTCSAEEVSYIVGHAEAKVILVENKSQWDKVAEHRKDLPNLTHIVLMDDAEKIEDDMTLSWAEFMGRGSRSGDTDFFSRLAALKPTDLATLIYTSGTTGPPKGVMINHDNLAFTTHQIRFIMDIRNDDRFISYLPLCHIAEQIFSIHGAITFGYEVAFAESIEKLADNIKEVRPTGFFGVPRIWEKFYEGLSAKLGLATGVKAKLVSWARSVAHRNYTAVNDGKFRSPRLLAEYMLANKLIYSKVKEALGLDQTRYFISGAAPIAKEVLEFMQSLDIPVWEVYGQSEDCGPTTFNYRGKTRLGTVGVAFPGVTVKIAEDDEILVKGRNVFVGYYKEEQATQETLEDGWLHSGDLGKFDTDGFLNIIGRKKDIIITAGGKNITPKNLESTIKNMPFVHEAVVIGDRRKYLTAVISVDDEGREKYAAQKGISKDAVHEDAALIASFQAGIDTLNASVARVEQIKKFRILPRPLTIEDKELTPTLKVKRNVVQDIWGTFIDEMYAED
jgi:long-chain acyl-CoA synthetase